MVRDVITAYVDGATGEGHAEDWDLDAVDGTQTLYPVGITADSLTRKDHESERDDLTLRGAAGGILMTPNVPAPHGKPNSRKSPSARVRCASWNATCCPTS